jgi:hypothetical protein
MSTVPQATTEGKGHEKKDADVTTIVLIAVGTLLLVLLVQLTVWMTLRHLRLNRAEKEQGAALVTERLKQFPDPRLQIDPALDLAKVRASDLRDLDTFAWIDRKAGVFRIPIERAMQLLSERGLPDVGENQTPLSLMQARPTAKKSPPPHKARY